MNDAKKDEAQRRLTLAGVEAGQIYRHYKGGLYSVIATAIKEDTLEPLVVYRSNVKGTIWVRTLEDWSESVSVPGPDVTVVMLRFRREED